MTWKGIEEVMFSLRLVLGNDGQYEPLPRSYNPSTAEESAADAAIDRWLRTGDEELIEPAVRPAVMSRLVALQAVATLEDRLQESDPARLAQTASGVLRFLLIDHWHQSLKKHW